MNTPIYLKIDAAEPLLLTEGVCRQLGMVTYHPRVLFSKAMRSAHNDGGRRSGRTKEYHMREQPPPNWKTESREPIDWPRNDRYSTTEGGLDPKAIHANLASAQPKDVPGPELKPALNSAGQELRGVYQFADEERVQRTEASIGGRRGEVREKESVQDRKQQRVGGENGGEGDKEEDKA